MDFLKGTVSDAEKAAQEVLATADGDVQQVVAAFQPTLLRLNNALDKISEALDRLMGKP